MADRITGNVTYLDFEGGFWGIETSDKKFMILNMPEQLKCNGLDVKCLIEEATDVATMFSYGTPAFIRSFKTYKFPK